MTTFIDTEGKIQKGIRNADGTYAIVLADETVLEFDASGNPIGTDELFNLDIVENQEEIRIDLAGEGLALSAIWDKESHVLSGFDEDGEASFTVTVDESGTILVENDNGLTEYDPVNGVTGQNTITYEWGETLVESIAGTVQISSDGLTFTNTDVNGATSTATAGPNGWIVVIDGVEYEYSY